MASMKEDDRKYVRDARGWLLGALLRWGVDESGHLIVATPRATRGKRGAKHQRGRLRGCVGYYSSLSQYRSRIRIVVIVKNVRRGIEELTGQEAESDRLIEEIKRTVAHEYAHAMAEAIKVEADEGNPLNVPGWRSRFDGDEEEFAEDFARFLTGSADCDASFWDEFMPRYGREWLRTFARQESALQLVETGIA